MNNNDYLDKFISNLESIKMTSNEKNEIRNNLASFAVSYTPIISPYHHVTLLFRRGLAVAFIAILSVGSVSNVVSGQALPGDTLYPVKIVHEEIKLAATLDSKNKISYEIRRTEKRIQEATELAIHNNLDLEKQVKIAESIKEQTEKVQEHIEEVSEENPEEALLLNAELKSTLKINAEALKQVSTTTEIKKIEVIEEDEFIKEVPEVIPEDVDVIEEIPAVIIKDVEYEVIEVSFAESLLESIEEDVKDTEIFEEKVSEQIILKDETDILNIDDTSTQEIIENQIDEINTEVIEEEIQSLEDILILKNEIKEIKLSSFSEEENILTEDINEILIYSDVDSFIKERKYKEAFLHLEKVLTHYKEQILINEIKLDLGIEFEEVISTENIDATTIGEIPQKDIIVLEEKIEN